ncbi:MAG: transglycosylase SLT domain-containing protein [Chloroflexi bacterium]|nr:transglycosylase SLT domain-containing protein [Chloroflexota bacterium]MCL5274895.1 transglycosylase SLT domain-containing protein [Chloroflexota bacterium]
MKLPLVGSHNKYGTTRWLLFGVLACIAGLLIACTPDKDPTTGAPVVEFLQSAVPTLAPSPTPSPTPTPTPDPAVLIKQAQHAGFNGDDAQAASLYQQALGILGQPTNTLAIQARMGLGQSQLGAGDTPSALSTFTAIVSDVVSGTAAVDAEILLGQAAARAGDNAAAVSYYSTTLAANLVISPYLALWLGDAYIAANQPISAVKPYSIAVAFASTPVQTVLRREKLALALQLSGRYADALGLYEANMTDAQYAITKARNEWASTQVLVAMGQAAAAYRQMNDIITRYPDLSYAFSAIQALDKAGKPVDDLQRGIVDYHAGENTAAQQAFKRAIARDSHLDEIRYWAALNYVDLGSVTDAYRNLNEIIANGADSPRYGDALIEKGNLLAAAGDYANAAAAYQKLADTAPKDPQAGTALQRIGRMYERAGMLEQAATAYLAAAAAYPADAGAPEALLRGAIALHRLGRFDEAAVKFQALISSYPSAQEAELAQLWLGKTQIAAGKVVTGQNTLADLALRKPDDYEGARAAELAADVTRVPLSKPFGKIVTPTLQQLDAQQTDAEKWLRSRLNISDTVDIRTMTATLSGDLRFLRGSELWRLGLQDDAGDEFDALRSAYNDNALILYQLALYLRDIGAYRQSIGAAAALMRAAKAGSIADTPILITRLVYPIYYPDLIDEQASAYALDPLLIAGLIRQESLFEPNAASGASAYGLMQVIPATGKEINTALKWPPNYSERDLTRPYISLRFGAYYLSRQRDALGGDLYAMLAAYNGGPGMASRWKDRSGGDPDALFMTMPLDGAGYRETQLYIRTVTNNYAIYHRLYAGD